MKTKTFFLKIWVFLACISYSFDVHAYDFLSRDICYNIIDSNTVEVTYMSQDYNIYSGDVIIPSKVIFSNITYKVIAIGDNAFNSCGSLTSVVIPSTVTIIGNNVFQYCPNLMSVICLASNPPEIEDETTVSNDNFNYTLMVPYSSVTAYKKACYWMNFISIVPLLQGDLNYDSKLDVSDVTALIAIVLGNTSTDSPLADINGDSFVDVSDVTLLIDYVLNGVPKVYEYELTTSERATVNDVITLLNKYNPNKEFITFGFITDTHTCSSRAEIQNATDIEDIISAIQLQGITLEPANEGSTIAADIKSGWPTDHEGINPYFGRTAEPLIKILGAAAYEYGIDLVIHGGDVSSGYIKYNAYAYMMEKVARLFDKYISVPHFICEGNHDYKYDSNVALRPNSDWRKYADRFNNLSGLSMTYVKDIPAAQTYAASYNIDISDYTSFYVDIDKGGLNKLRFASAVVFERNSSAPNPSPISRYFVLNMNDKEDVEQWSAINIAHVQDNNYLDNYAGAFYNANNMGAYSSTENTFSFPKQNGGKKPKSYIGAIFGHNHDSSYGRVSLVGGGYAPRIRVANSYNDPDVLPTFSIFIFDTVNWWLYEIQVLNKRRGISGFSEGIYENTDSLENAWCYCYKLSHH